MELNEIHNNIYIKLSAEFNRLKEEKIKQAVERRCEDLTNNQ